MRKSLTPPSVISVDLGVPVAEAVDGDPADGHTAANGQWRAAGIVGDGDPILYTPTAAAEPLPTPKSGLADDEFFSLDFPGFASHAAHGKGPADSQVTLFDSASFAKGPPGGGGGGGGSGTGLPKTYHSGAANGLDGYDIVIDFKGTGWTADLQQAFKNAADYFTTIITYDAYGSDGRVGKIFVDDLYVTATLATIDGAGGVLGQAGPTAVWTYSENTATGQMQFDVADAQYYLGRGLWDDIVTHEMMHVLGVGSLWNYGSNGLVSGSQYDGYYAVQAYNQMFGTNVSFIPVESAGGPGTAGAHWDEATLANELMTGYINDDGDPATTTDNYLSKFSVMSLADLDYFVEYQDYPHDGIVIV